MKKAFRTIWEAIKQLICWLFVTGVMIGCGVLLLIEFSIMIPIGSIVSMISTGGSLTDNYAEILKVACDSLVDALGCFKD